MNDTIGDAEDYFGNHLALVMIRAVLLAIGNDQGRVVIGNDQSCC
jgi:hypothetical protein